MARPRSLKSLVAFTGGEMTPLMDARADTEKYQSGCRQMQNYLPLAHGAATRRRGFRHIAAAKFDTTSKTARMQKFQLSSTDGMMIEAGHLYMRFFKNQAQIAPVPPYANAAHPADWATSTNYLPGALVRQSGTFNRVYFCLVQHLSGTFANDLANAYWLDIGPAEWVTATAYAVGDYRAHAGHYYQCLVAHTSGTFATDLGNGDWVLQETIYELTTPYLSLECFAIQTAQKDDVVFIAHPLHILQKLIRYADNVWSIGEAVLDSPPLLDENTGTITITPSAKAKFLPVDLTASSSLFSPSHVGSYWQIKYISAATNSTLGLGSANGTTSGVPVNGAWTLDTAGIWSGTLELQTSDDNSTWVTLRLYYSLTAAGPTGGSNYTDSGIQEGAKYYRLKFTWVATGATAPVAIFRTQQSIQAGIVRIDTYHSAIFVSGIIIEQLFDTAATTRWSEGAYSTLRGFPTSVALFQQRLWLGGTAHEPQRFDGSRVGVDYQNFDTGVNDPGGATALSAVTYELSSDDRNQILWMIGQKRLIIGTSGGVWAAYGDELEGAITATKPPLILKQNNIAVAYERALLLSSVVLFVQSSGRKLREMVFDGSQGIFTADDLAVLSNHITAGGMATPSYQKDRDSIFWAVTGFGYLIGLTYDKAQNILAWHRHITSGTFESCDVIDGGGVDNEVWCSVIRTINGTQRRFIECMSGYFTPSVDPETVASVGGYSGLLVNAFFVDGGTTVTRAAALTVTGLTHLAAMAVDVLADGVVRTGLTVNSSGVLTLPVAAAVVNVGLHYDSKLQPMRIDTDPQQGQGQGLIKRIHHLGFRLMDSGGALVAKTATDTSPATIIIPGVYFGLAQFTGDIEHPYSGDYNEDATFVLLANGPLPLTVLGVFVKYTVTESP